MPTGIRSDGDALYGDLAVSEPSVERRPYGSVGEQIFLWVAWAVAFAFWAFTMTTFFGILSALADPTPAVPGGASAGGGVYLIGVFLALIVLGIALAYGAARWATRDRRMDPTTEASTAALYDAVERAGGDGMVTRSPEARRPEERDSYRPV